MPYKFSWGPVSGHKHHTSYGTPVSDSGRTAREKSLARICALQAFSVRHALRVLLIFTPTGLHYWAPLKKFF